MGDLWQRENWLFPLFLKDCDGFVWFCLSSWCHNCRRVFSNFFLQVVGRSKFHKQLIKQLEWVINQQISKKLCQYSCLLNNIFYGEHSKLKFKHSVYNFIFSKVIKVVSWFESQTCNSNLELPLIFNNVKIGYKCTICFCFDCLSHFFIIQDWLKNVWYTAGIDSCSWEAWVQIWA